MSEIKSPPSVVYIVGALGWEGMEIYSIWTTREAAVAELAQAKDSYRRGCGVHGFPLNEPSQEMRGKRDDGTDW